MILKIKNEETDFGHKQWVYIGNVKTLGFAKMYRKQLFLENMNKRAACKKFDNTYLRDAITIYGENFIFGVLTIIFNDGREEKCIIDREAYLLNDTGGTIEKLEIYNMD